MMEESHFNSSYFWSPIPTVPGQVSVNVGIFFVFWKNMCCKENLLSPIPDRECHVPEQDERAAGQECFLPRVLSVTLPNSCSHHPHIGDKDGWRRTGRNHGPIS